ncbi:Protein K03A11.6 [Aphelenchoides avenae]|nr:Protein K03A11.6 [Aphelenchus avenae]
MPSVIVRVDALLALFTALSIIPHATPQCPAEGQSRQRCQRPNGALLPTAESCTDTLPEETCQVIFSGSGYPRPFLCDNTEMQDKAMKCRKTCKICCEIGGASGSVDGDCYDKGSNCAVNQGLCNNSIYLNIMTENCKKTCGKCRPTSAYQPQPAAPVATCYDSHSRQAHGFCTNNYYSQDIKRSYCSRSCGYC